MNTTPVRLAVDHEAQTLTVEWGDGHASSFSYEGLRQACPCVECRGGHGKMAESVDPVVFRLPALMMYEIKTVEPSGNYAAQITWGDGHRSGFYRWTDLRAWCPCERCREA
ncbi:MAG: DUF971 domain-containing protein [Rhodothermaceae bacterium]|nr:DUF971 domain-containing protein [Rhodothermaceae bacterium]